MALYWDPSALKMVYTVLFPSLMADPESVYAKWGRWLLKTVNSVLVFQNTKCNRHVLRKNKWQLSILIVRLLLQVLLLYFVLLPSASCRVLFWFLRTTGFLWWEQGFPPDLFSEQLFWSYFTLAFSSCSFLNFSLQRTMQTWLAFSQFDWLQDTFCKCHSGCVRCVHLW